MCGVMWTGRKTCSDDQADWFLFPILCKTQEVGHHPRRIPERAKVKSSRYKQNRGWKLKWSCSINNSSCPLVDGLIFHYITREYKVLHYCLISTRIDINFTNMLRKLVFSTLGDLAKLSDWVSPSSVQFSHSVVSNSLWSHEPQHARPPCP